MALTISTKQEQKDSGSLINVNLGKHPGLNVREHI